MSLFSGDLDCVHGCLAGVGLMARKKPECEPTILEWAVERLDRLEAGPAELLQMRQQIAGLRLSLQLLVDQSDRR